MLSVVPVTESVGSGLFRRMVSLVSGTLPLTLSIPGVTGALVAPSSVVVVSLLQAKKPASNTIDKIFFICPDLSLSLVIQLSYQGREIGNKKLR